MSDQTTSKYISLILRHQPEIIGISLDEHGWANVDELVRGVSITHPMTIEDLEEIVRSDKKQRFSFNEDHSLIRANQGHSIAVDVELERCQFEPNLCRTQVWIKTTPEISQYFLTNPIHNHHVLIHGHYASKFKS